MSTDNTTPRLTRELGDAHKRLTAIIPRIPIVVGRLDAEQPGFPTGHTGSGNGQDGPDRFQTDDPAYGATRALLDAHRRLTLAVAELDRITGNWMRRQPTTRDAGDRDTTSSIWCVSCLRVGSTNPRRAQGGDLCRWCLDTLRAVNHHRRTTNTGAPLNELPVAAVQRHARGERTRDIDIATWAKGDKKPTNSR